MKGNNSKISILMMIILCFNFKEIFSYNYNIGKLTLIKKPTSSGKSWINLDLMLIRDGKISNNLSNSYLNLNLIIYHSENEDEYINYISNHFINDITQQKSKKFGIVVKTFKEFQMIHNKLSEFALYEYKPSNKDFKNYLQGIIINNFAGFIVKEGLINYDSLTPNQIFTYFTIENNELFRLNKFLMDRESVDIYLNYDLHFEYDYRIFFIILALTTLLVFLIYTFIGLFNLVKKNNLFGGPEKSIQGFFMFLILFIYSFMILMLCFNLEATYSVYSSVYPLSFGTLFSYRACFHLRQIFDIAFWLSTFWICNVNF